VNHFIRCTRLEYLANKLINNPKLNMTEIAYSSGFSSSSCFSREFRRYFGISATTYRYQKILNKSKIGKQEGEIYKKKDKIGKEMDSSFDYNDYQMNLIRRSTMKFRVEVKKMPEMNVAHIQHKGPYNQIGQAILENNEMVYSKRPD